MNNEINDEVKTDNTEATNVEVTSTETTPDVNVANSSDNSVKKKNNNAVGIIAIIVVVALVLVGGFLVYKNFSGKDPVTISKKTFNKFGKSAKKMIVSLNDDANKYLDKAFEGTVSLDVSGNKISTGLGYDKNKQLMYLNLDTDANIGGTTIKDKGNLIVTKDKAYIKINNGEDYYISEDFSKVFETLENKHRLSEQYAKFITYFGEAFENTIKDEEFKESNEDIIIEGKTIKTTKYGLKIDKKMVNKMFSNYADLLLNDDELIDALYEDQKAFDDSITKEKVKSSIKENFSVDDEDDESYYEDIYYDMYVKNNNIYRMAFYTEENATKPEAKIDLYDGVRVVLNADDDVKVDVTLKDELLKINVNSGDSVDIKVTYETDKKLDADVSIDDKNITVSAIIDKEKKSNKENSKIDFTVDLFGTKIEGVLKLGVSYNDKLSVTVPNNALDLKNEENNSKFMNEINSSTMGSLIYTYLSGLNGTDMDDYDDYDDDSDDDAFNDIIDEF